jgi:hypothetical protein
MNKRSEIGQNAQLLADNGLAGLEPWREKNRAIKQAMMQKLLTRRTRLV